MKNKNTLKLVECALVIALATVLSVLKIWQMPLGGSITLLSMLPICLFSVRRGVSWGLAASFLYSVIQFFLGGSLAWGLSTKVLLACALGDYIVAYTVIGLSGMFRRKGVAGIIAGSIGAMILRFACHYATGVTIWKNIEPWELFGSIFTNSPELYSVLYNGFYMLPEIVFTTVALVIIIKIPVVDRKILNVEG